MMHSRPKGRYRVSRDALAEIKQAYVDYKQVIETSGMALTSRKKYIIHARNRRPKRGFGSS